MTGARMPVVRLSSSASEEGGADEPLDQEPVIVELSSTSKFGIAWAAEQPPQVPLPLGAERPVALSSSEGETDVSEEELSAPVKRASRPEDFGEDPDFVTPTNHLNSEQNPMDQAGRLAVPRLSRAFSMPLPSQLSLLQNPRRPSVSGTPPTVTPPEPPEVEHFRELSLELADSVQMVIQTLLQLSPPQVLDPAKEQFSACSLSIPTPSISAMFTTMKNLNYMSANMSRLGSIPQTSEGHAKSETLSTTQNDFDVGEMLQSVGDALSGVAAQAGVDLVLFHSDVGMKHVAVKGDESGLSYTLSHILRQVIGTAEKRDTVEVGLHIDYGDFPGSRSENGGTSPSRVASPSMEDEGLIRCNFRIIHRTPTSDQQSPSEEVQTSLHSRVQPSFDTLILRRLLKHVGATFTCNELPSTSSTRRVCELTAILEPGAPSAVNPSVTVSPQDAAVLGYPDMQISDEPTLEQLVGFAETLRGKSVTLYASSSGSFAHHLSSYLTAWGMNVSHMSTEPGADGEYELIGDGAESNAASASGAPLGDPAEHPPASSPPIPPRKTGTDPTFILIDDDVNVLRSRLQKHKAEQVLPLNMRSHKRPSLASNHRPRSSPQVARVMSMLGNNPPPPQVVIVHFTSLANFKLVKDAVQSSLTPTKESAGGRIPEVIVIPKPAGPRRFLTALHTAVTRPVVDPYFVPIATSPMSPGLHSISPFFNIAGVPRSPSGRSSGSGRASSDRSARSPKELGGEFTTGHAPPSPLGQSDNMEYFSDAVVKLGASPATGMIIQSPDGQPTGIFFHPKPRISVVPSPSTDKNSEAHVPRHRPYSRVPSGEKHEIRGGNGTPGYISGRPSPRQPSAMPEPLEVFGATPPKAKAKQPAGTISEDSAPPAAEPPSPAPAPEPSPAQTSHRFLPRRQSQQAMSPPASPQTRAAPGPSASRRPSRRPTTSDVNSPGTKKGGKGPGDGNIVPPISVLIVDDNPINQTILTTFMKKKKIKFDVAKNGEEAVHKWRSGTFHLILMDIQMPVMDGIQATKEIRRLEKQGGQGFPSTPQSEGQRTPSEASTTDSRNMSTPPYRSSVIIVALTASSLQADRVAALGAGCNDFLTKPVSLEWLNNKIIEWGSIKALQMWADIRPDVVRSITTEQTAQAQQVARRLHVPEGRSSPAAGDRVRTNSMASRRSLTEGPPAAAAATLTPNTPLSDDSPGLSSSSTDPSKSANPLSAAIASMSASEAALSLASAHRPQASADDRRASSDGLPPDAIAPDSTLAAPDAQNAEAAATVSSTGDSTSPPEPEPDTVEPATAPPPEDDATPHPPPGPEPPQ